MPGPVSGSYDPEFGTAAEAARFADETKRLHGVVGEVIGSDPIYMLELIDKRDEMSRPIEATLTEFEWRMIRLALERAQFTY